VHSFSIDVPDLLTHCSIIRYSEEPRRSVVYEQNLPIYDERHAARGQLPALVPLPPGQASSYGRVPAPR
jgi:hypothetical protein